MPSNLKWYDSNVKRTIRLQGQEGIVRVAMLARRQARRNLTEGDHNDAKFLWNSIGVATPDQITPIPPDGDYLSSKTGKMVHRESGPIPQPAEGAVVFAAASHAIYVEMEDPFLYRAIEQVAGRQAEDAMVGLGIGLFADEGEE